MNLQAIVDNLITNTVETSLPLFRPELILCATIVLLLLVKVFRWGQELLVLLAIAGTGAAFWYDLPCVWMIGAATVVLALDRAIHWGKDVDPFLLALVGAAIAFWYALPDGGLAHLGDVHRREIFTGMLVYDSMTVFFRLFLLAFAVWFVILVRMTGLADKQDGQDCYTLLLGATLGMCLMASANHLMIVFLAVEMASVPSYVLAGIIKGRQRASEAALKYAVYGAGAAGVMLYGISLLAGLLGTAHLPTIAARLAELDIPGMLAGGEGSSMLMVLALAGLMIMVGLAFKLSAVPFHFWCPDVFEGASAEVDAFLSVASKAAAMALLVRVVLGVSGMSAETSAAVQPPVPVHAVALLQTADSETAGEPVGEVASAARYAAAANSAAGSTTPLTPVRTFIVLLLAVVSAVTCTFGNLAAYGQTNIKRLMAYSTIAHAGYMMMAVAAAAAMVGRDDAGTRTAVAALLFYLGVYVFMNLGAFSTVAFLRNAMQSEAIADYAGLIRCCPVTSVALVVILFSLIGLPPLAGFFGKFAIFAALVDAGGPLMITLLVIAGLNTVVSLIYYLRVAKTVCIDPEPEGREPVSIDLLPVAYVTLVALPVLYFGILPQSLAEWAQQASAQLLM